MEESVLVAGSGGQGVLLLGRLIATAGMLSGLNVTWFPSYGAEMRGGTANCTVVLSSEMIGSPVVRSPSSLIIMNCPSFLKFTYRLRPEGLLLVDSSLVSPEKCGSIEMIDTINGFRYIEIPASDTASSIGSVRFANMVLFGAYIRSTGLCDIALAEQALKMTLPERHHSKLPYNIEAIKRGWSIAGQ